MSDLPLHTGAGAAADPPLDRTISPIAGRLASGGRGKAVAFLGLLVGCAAVALATWRAEPAPRRAWTAASARCRPWPPSQTMVARPMRRAGLARRPPRGPRP
jgi:hypothetical protein